MTRTRLTLSAAALGLALLAGAGWLPRVSPDASLTASLSAAPAAQAAGTGEMVPYYEWDPYWPKRPLPNHWAIGNTVGLYADAKDHIWIVHRPRTLLAGHEDDAAFDTPESECCVPAPAVIEFDQAGSVVQAWGGPSADAFKKSGVGGQGVIQERFLMWKKPQGYVWPESEHTLFVDHKDNVWVGNNGGAHILKFTRDGKYLLTVGVPGKKADSNDTTAMRSPAGVTVDPKTNELYVADGYGNRRVIVWDADTGAYKRHWGAYGKKPDDGVPFKYSPTGPPSQQMNTVHCVWIDNKDEVYVCDRANSRIQVFKKDGTFIKEASVAPQTMRGSVLDLAFSRDKEQKWIFVADGRNEKVWILRHSDMKVVGSFGSAGHFGGQFTIAHNITIDSKNNLYVSESLTGQRVQRFLYKGLRASTLH